MAAVRVVAASLAVLVLALAPALAQRVVDLENATIADLSRRSMRAR